MKFNKLTAAILGSIAASSTMAINYDGAEPPVGSRLAEWHAFSATSSSGTECAPSGDNCGSSLESEFQAIITVLNKSSCTALTGVCTNNPGADSYANGDTVSFFDATVPGVVAAPALSVLGAHFHAPACDYTNDLTCGRDFNLTNIICDYNFTTDENGKINSGFIVAESSLGGAAPIIGQFNFDNGSAELRSYGVACDIDASGNLTNFDQTCLADPTQTPVGGAEGCFTGTGFETDNGVHRTTQPVDYVTAVAGGGKAVPMPAYAAAALGLGLVGVTVLTGRRKALK